MRNYIFLVLAAWPSLLLAAPVESKPVEPKPVDLPEWRYTVRPGDTLIGVAQQYLDKPAEWQKLQRLNRIVDPRRLPPASSLRIPYAWLRQQPAPAKVIAVSGQVEATLPEAAPAALAVGSLLPAGSEIRTAANSSAGLLFADGSRMIIQPGSSIQLDTVSVYAGGGMADTRVRMRQGRAEFSANPQKQPGSRLEVITPSAIAAVRGTVFRVAAEENLMREETLEGRVGVSAAAAEVSVGQAMGTLAEQGKPPIPPVALLVAPDLSGQPLKLDRYPLRFTLPVNPAAEAWQAQIAPDRQFENILLEKQARGPVIAFAELPDGRYVLRVRGVDAKGIQGLDAMHDFEVDAHPFPPFLTQPGDRAKVRNPRPKLSWTQSVEAEKYRVQLARDAAFKDNLLDQVVAADGVEVQTDLQPGDYFWRTASIAQSGEVGPYTDTRRFEYKALPGAPELSTKTLDFDGDYMRMALPSLLTGQHYEAVLAKDQKLQRIVWQGKPDKLSLKIPRPDAGAYFLGVRAVEEDGTAGPFATQGIEVPSKPIWPYLLILLTPLLFR